MLELLTILLLVAGIVVVTGFYRGWFQVNRQPSFIGGNQIHYNVTIDQDKMRADAKSIEKKAGLSEPDLRKD